MRVTIIYILCGRKWGFVFVLSPGLVNFSPIVAKQYDVQDVNKFSSVDGQCIKMISSE